MIFRDITRPRSPDPRACDTLSEMDAALEDGLTAEVRATRRRTHAADWALVLHAMDIDHRVDERDDALVLLVSPRARAEALASLDAFDLENLPVVDLPAPDLGPSWLGVVFAWFITWMFVVAGPRDVAAPSRWFEVGSASASHIVTGEWWRTVTAVTLHGDWLHLLGNVLAALLFVSAVGRWLGAGLGGALILVAAAAGNAVTAWSYGARHDSVGASTATFGALGVLAGLQMVRRWRDVARRRRHAWVPLGAGLGLVVLIGMSERADVVAHLASLLAGVVAGVSVGVSGVRAPRPLAQAAWSAVTVAVLVVAWVTALGGWRW